MKKLLLSAIVVLFAVIFQADSLFATSDAPVKFYKIDLKQEINASAFKRIKTGLDDALKQQADYCIIDINTYGGAVDAADSIRGAILRFPIPVIAFINVQAVSAGALISIACDSIYMRSGGSFGAATVVNQTGEVMPDKYQSFMRAMMRSTAESHGKKSVIVNGEETEVWKRDPQTAQAMVSKDSVLSFTPLEAIKNGYCEGMAENINEVVEKVIQGGRNYDMENVQSGSVNNFSENKSAVEGREYILVEQHISFLEKVIYFLMSPYMQGILLMLIIGGIYFELQSPGVGLPLAAAITGAVLYFAPLYLEGLAQNWELLMFIVGVGLLFAEILIIPGFGVAGVSGIILVTVSLVFAMIDNDIVFNGGDYNLKPLIKPFAIVLVSTTVAFLGSVYLASKLYGSRAFSHIVLHTSLADHKGFVGVETDSLVGLIGCQAIVATDLKPQGSVEIHGKRYQAQLLYGYASKGESVTVVKAEEGRLFVDHFTE
ncbi:MAG: NfeD family protein [Bacteroidales bacterium]